MKCTLPEISWHNREPVLSVDFYPICIDKYILASGGGDCHILIWQLTVDPNGAVKNEVLSDLTKHQRAVNVVRWSPLGSFLASADDDANLIVWKSENVEGIDEENRQNWNVFKILRGHKEDIYDLCWSMDCTKILSGSIDNSAILWDVNKGKYDKILTDHKGFVQGVAWDPKNQYVATISTDRILRIYDSSGKQLRARISKGKLPVPTDHYLHDKEVKYFHDDTFKSFFRRLAFSPDGSILIAPSGHIILDDCKKTLNCSFVFVVETNTPAAVLPLPKQCSTVARFCPLLFELRDDGPEPVLNLPYRMVFAVGCDHDVILYDTQQMKPFARFHNIHYTRLTDLTWSSDGRLLVASSTDGFCALVTFDKNEIGVPYVKEESEDEEADKEAEVAKENSKNEDNKIEEVEVKEETKIKSTPTSKKTSKKTPVTGKASILSFLKKPDEPVQKKAETEPPLPKDDDCVVISETTPTRKRIAPIQIGGCSEKKQMTLSESIRQIEDKIEPEKKRIAPIPVDSSRPATKKRITPIQIGGCSETITRLYEENIKPEVKKRITPIPVDSSPSASRKRITPIPVSPKPDC